MSSQTMESGDLGAEDREINFLLAAHPQPDNVAYGRNAAFKGLQRFLAYHTAIGHHSDFQQLEVSASA
jgi:hypothetical protein